jgi:alkylhydroperoxidase family enzyme
MQMINKPEEIEMKLSHYKLGINTIAFLLLFLIHPVQGKVITTEEDRNSSCCNEKPAHPIIEADHQTSTNPTDSIEKQTMNVKEKEARIPPLPMSKMKEEWNKILERLPGAGLKGKFSPVNVFGTIMHNPGTFGPFLDYWITSKLEMGFTGREQELVILRMGYHYQCNYVWKHHVPVAREYGVTDEEIEAVKTSPLPPVFSARESALLHLTDEMVEYRTIRDEAWSKWSNELKTSEKIDLISLVSQYVFFSLLNNSLQIEVEEPLKNIPGL